MPAVVVRRLLGLTWWGVGVVQGGGCCGCGVSVVYQGCLLPRLLLHDLWAGRRGLLGSPAFTWSAVHGSLVRVPSPQIQQVVAASLTALARLR